MALRRRLTSVFNKNSYSFRGKTGGYSNLQPYAYSTGMSFELLTAAIGPQASLLQCLDLPTENDGEKLVQNKGRGCRILTSNENVLTFVVANDCAKFHQKSNINCDHRSADRQRDSRTRVIL